MTMQLVLVSRAIYGLHGYGGMERHCSDWIRAMSELGNDVHVVTTVPEHPELVSSFDRNVRFYFLPGAPARSVLTRITRYPAWVERAGQFVSLLLRDGPVAVVYAHGLAAAGCNRLPVPVFYNPHGMEEFQCRGAKYIAYSVFRRLSRAAAASAARVIATDEIQVPQVRRFLRVPDQRIAVIPNAVRIDPFEKAPRDPGSDPRFLFVGRLEPNKGMDVLLKALAAVRLACGWKLTVAGDGSQRPALEALSRNLGIESGVVFAGRVPDERLEELYRDADLFLNPTLYEGSSIVTLEAMAHQLPVVGTQAGGLPDKVFPGENGWLVPPGQVAPLAAAIEEACRQRDRWPQMGRRSAAIVADRFSIDAAARRFLELADEVRRIMACV